MCTMKKKDMHVGARFWSCEKNNFELTFLKKEEEEEENQFWLFGDFVGSVLLQCFTTPTT